MRKSSVGTPPYIETALELLSLLHLRTIPSKRRVILSEDLIGSRAIPAICGSRGFVEVPSASCKQLELLSPYMQTLRRLAGAGIQ